MRRLILGALGACLVASGAMAATPYSATDLLIACTNADNDAREVGTVAELECEQYIMGFVHALEVTGDSTVCAPKQNTADEVRWAYMRWVHEDYSGRKDMGAGAALLGTLREQFACQ